MELDHLFICTAPGAVAAARLAAAGFVEGSRSRHPGQGTANRRFFFHNAMLELLWIEDESAARSAATAALRLWERRPGGGACPFGVCFRPAAAGAGTPAPFAAVAYRPAYLPDGLQVDVAADAPTSEPLWFYLAFARTPDPQSPGEPRDHPAGARRLTGLRIGTPGAGPWSPAARAAAGAGVHVQHDLDYLLQLQFDYGARGECADFRPQLPLIARW